MKSRLPPAAMRRIAIILWAVAGLLVVAIAWRLLLVAPPDEAGPEALPPLQTSDVVRAPTGHAYKYVAAPNLPWDQARARAASLTFQGHRGYLATIGDVAEFDFIMANVFPNDTDVTYLGGRQTAPGEWRWVTGPDGAADGGKGTLFWKGYEDGAVQGGHFADWMDTAFQHGSLWDEKKVCCVTLFSYRKRQFSTSLGTGFADERVAGYLVEFGE